MTEKILAFKDCLPGLTPEGFVKQHLSYTGSACGPINDPADITVAAEINAFNMGGSWQWQGRWIVRCPANECFGAEYVDPDTERFFCLSCYNHQWGGQWLKVAFPPNRKVIETILLLRPGRNRFWLPGETVGDLQKENKEHGYSEGDET